MQEIGGFFELELRELKEYHENYLLNLNTGRNCIRYGLLANKIRKIYLPYYICSSVSENLSDLDIEIVRYNIDNELFPILDFEKIKEDECLIYVNYFGAFVNNVKKIIEIKKSLNFKLCIDNTQGFFYLPLGEDITVNSARKFFGVFDGAYLYSKKKIEIEMEREIAFDKSIYLLKRIDTNAKLSYEDFKKSSLYHKERKIKKVSRLSEKILKSIDYEYVIEKRNMNFKFINTKIGKTNKLNIDIDSIKGPMVYPFWIENGKFIREKLIENNIFIAQYWPGILNEKNISNLEKDLIENTVCIPIDQRYGYKELETIINNIYNILNL